MEAESKVNIENGIYLIILQFPNLSTRMVKMSEQKPVSTLQSFSTDDYGVSTNTAIIGFLILWTDLHHQLPLINVNVRVLQVKHSNMSAKVKAIFHKKSCHKKY